MTVTRQELIETRIKLLKEMDTFARENIDEDLVIDIWFTIGLEDGWTEDILYEYANNEDLWTDCCKSFGVCYTEQRVRDGA